MVKFKVGDRVRLVRPHTSHGSSYDREADIGDVGEITSKTTHLDDNYQIKWVRRVGPIHAPGVSRIDGACLAFDSPTISEDPW